MREGSGESALEEGVLHLQAYQVQERKDDFIGSITGTEQGRQGWGMPLLETQVPATCPVSMVPREVHGVWNPSWADSAPQGAVFLSEKGWSQQETWLLITVGSYFQDA